MKMHILGLLTGSLLLGASCAQTTAETLDVDKALKYCDSQVNRSIIQLGNDSADFTLIPRNIANTDSVWHCRKVTPEEWCSGFWPGILWYDYELTGNENIKDKADKYTRSLEFLSKAPAFDHDLGFLMFCSYGNAYRLTGDETYKQAVLATADTLATLFNPNVGTILSWPRNVEMLGGHNTIMDNMINLEMLFWASKNGGDKSLYDIAVKHAETTMKNHFRPDHSCYHVAVYDPETGAFIKGMNHQGYADNSMWARGQAWAIYGYTMVYRETRDPKFLDFACNVADVYIDRLPEDYVPFWDFKDPAIPNVPRDASAASIVASALLELQGYCDAEKGKHYRDSAVKMLTTLSSKDYLSGDKRPSFLDHSVGHMPAGSEIDASIVYADYYYMEALLRLKKLENFQNVFAALK